MKPRIYQNHKATMAGSILVLAPPGNESSPVLNSGGRLADYVDFTLGYNNANTTPLLLRLLSRADELIANVQNQSIIRYAV
jgi:hypothetical protein